MYEWVTATLGMLLVAALLGAGAAMYPAPAEAKAKLSGHAVDLSVDYCAGAVATLWDYGRDGRVTQRERNNQRSMTRECERQTGGFMVESKRSVTSTGKKVPQTFPKKRVDKCRLSSAYAYSMSKRKHITSKQRKIMRKYAKACMVATA
ncbi:hypothetical protein [Brevibacterium moorei]|uniref:hypothetical protein n=1 Tax=Brevibacterium moorei TaxID=2968457 RepID=UPI00211D07DE|nr:hypothetical protein [Brevibacterium sp. 68QC2CO]MCQ9385135.1 hypothetical protein [Brevibacterium sp. 68QC2CO]